MKQNKPAKKTAAKKRTAAAALLLLLFCLICTAPALGGAITVDTTGLTGKTTDTILVPVTVTGPGVIEAWQLSAKTGDFDNAKIVFNTESVIKAGAASGENLIYWFEASNPDNYIRTDETLFYLAVTPKVEGQILLEIYDVYVYESVNGKTQEVKYDVVNGSLTVSGTGTGNTVGDSESGATVIYGVTEHGIYNTGDENGLARVELMLPDGAASVNDTTVLVYRGTAGIFEIPQSLGYFSVNDIYIGANVGDPLKLTFGVSQSELNAAGAAIEDIFVLHNVNGIWYNTTIVQRTPSGDYSYVTIETWSTSPFIVCYDAGGVEYQKETKYTALGGSAPLDIPWAIIGIAALAVIIIIIASVIVVKRKNRNRN